MSGTSRRRRDGLWNWLCLQVAEFRMNHHREGGRNKEVMAIGTACLARRRGTWRIHAYLCSTYWDESRWAEAIRHGRLSLGINANQPKTAGFLLAAYRSAKRYPAGIAFGERWIGRFGGPGSVYRHLSFLHDDLDQPAAALKWARQGFARDGSDRRLAACLVNYLAKVEGEASAAEFFRRYRGLFAGDTYCENTIAEGFNSCGAHAESERLFAGVVAREPRNATALYNLLEVWHRMGKHAETMAAIERWQRAGGELTAPLANEAARACMALGRADDSIAWIKQAMALAPGKAKYLDNHAVILGRLDRAAESIVACRERLAAGGDADRRRLLKTLGVALTETDQHEEALGAYLQAFAEFPHDEDTLINVVVGYTWLKRYADGMAFAEQHRASHGPRQSRRYWSEFAWSCHQAGQYEAELDVAQEWMRRHPDDPTVFRALRRSLNRLERKTEALERVRAWVESHPTVAEGWWHLSTQYGELDLPDKELEAIVECRRLDPDDIEAVDSHVAVLRALKRTQEAIDTGVAWLGAHAGRESGDLLNRIGLAADDLEQWPLAETYYRRAHTLNPRAAVWCGNLMRALILQDRANEAVELAQRWLAANAWSNYIASKLAWAWRRRSDRSQEAVVLRRAVQEDPANEDMRFDLLTNLVDRKLTDEAQALIAEAEKGGRATSRLVNDWGNYLGDIGRNPEAEAAYRRALELKPDNDTAAGNLAVLLVRLGRGREAVTFCRAWLEQRPEDRYVRRQLANAFYTLGDYPPAEAEYRKLLEAEPKSGFLFGRLAACLRLAGRYEQQLTEAAAWLVGNEPTAFLAVEMGFAAKRLGRREEALRHIEVGLGLEPGSIVGATNKIALLAELGRYREAIEYGEAWVAKHTADADLWNELAIALDATGQTGKAGEYFLKAAEMEPDNATLAGNAVDILCRRGRLAEAILLGQRLLANSPPNAYLMRRLAEAYSEQHEHHVALDLLASADVLAPADLAVAREFLRIAQEGEEFERGLEFGRKWLGRPGNERITRIWESFARLCFRADHDEEAFRAVEKAMEIEPDVLAHARLRFGFWNALEDSNRVIAEYETLRPEWRDNPDLMRYQSRAYADLGMSDEALDVARRTVTANPGDVDACVWLAELYEKLDRREEAGACLRQWTEVHGEHCAVWRMRARLSLQAKEHDGALADAERVLAERPSDEEAFVVSVRALRALRRDAEARMRLLRWIEHEPTTARITELLDEDQPGNGS